MKGFSGRPVPQQEDELRELIELFAEKNVHSYLEVGARYGDSMWEIACSLPQGSRIVVVDMPSGPWGKGDSLPLLKRAVKDLKHRGYDVHMILGSSHDEQVIEQVRALGPYDACLLDADHTMEAITADWEAYSPMCRLVSMHDIDTEHHRPTRSGQFIDVWRIWRELVARMPNRTRAIIGQEGGMGIGVVFMEPAS